MNSTGWPHHYLAAIPLFTFSGVVLAAGGAPQRMIQLFNALVGWLPGVAGVALTMRILYCLPRIWASHTRARRTDDAYLSHAGYRDGSVWN
jgi:TRAP-type mannitol/chloroaromatic compound transport system permease large subunit